MNETVRDDFLPFSRPTISTREEGEILESLRSGWLTTGPKVAHFEELLADYFGAAHVIATNSGTAALNLALRALDLQPGDEVITPSLTWPSAVNMVELLGGRPIFADIDPNTLQVDIADVAAKISPRTRAIVPVHFAGQPSDLGSINDTIQDRDIAIVEDAAHAIGTEYRGAMIGATSRFAVFSFHPNKNITTGEGGALVGNDEVAFERLRLLKFHGVSKDAWKRYEKQGDFRYEVVEPGYKYNMLDIQAALGIHQLPRIDEFNERRGALASRYGRLLADLPEIRPLGTVPYPHKHSWHLYIVTVDTDALGATRDEVMLRLRQMNIGCGLHYTPVHLHKYYREKYGFRSGYLPATEHAGERILSLPLFPRMEESDQDDVIEALHRIVRGQSR